MDWDTIEKLFYEELDDLVDIAGGGLSLEEICDAIDELSAGTEEDRTFVSQVLFFAGEEAGLLNSDDKINEILDCLEEVFNVNFPREIIV